MKVITTNTAPKACGAYSQAIRSGNFIFCAGQIGLDPKTDSLIEGGIGEQTHQTIKNISEILKSESLSLSDVIKTTIFLGDINDWGIVNDIYAEYFAHKPARSTIAVVALPAGAKIEIEVVAEVK